jgi:hypothetical protein
MSLRSAPALGLSKKLSFLTTSDTHNNFFTKYGKQYVSENILEYAREFFFYKLIKCLQILHKTVTLTIVKDSDQVW